MSDRDLSDRYARIRKALAMGPTPGPWEPSYDKGSTRDIITQKEKYPICMVRGIAYVGQEQYLANGYFIAACDPDTIRELLAERDQLAAEIDALRAEVDEWKDMARCASEQQDSLFREALALNKRAERLAEALRDAATSMQTIADKAGRDEYLMTTDEVRGYANSRANAARAALAKENE